MDPQRQQQKAKAASGTYNLIPGGGAHARRKFVAARFPQGSPAFAQEEYVVAFEQQPQQAPSKQLQQLGQPPQKKDPTLLLSRKQQPGVPPRQLQGLPRTDTAGNYFVLCKSGGKYDFVVQPLETTFTFKQLARSPALSIEEVEAGMRASAAAASAAGADRLRLVPKSVRQELQDAAAAEAAERKLHDEVAPLIDKAKVAELTVKYGGSSGSTAHHASASSEHGHHQHSKLVLHSAHSDDEDDEGLWGGAGGGKERGGAGGKGAAGKGGRRGGKGGGSDGPPSGVDIPDDELPEDIYEGEEDELRPAAPTEDVDWEFAERAADDDLDQGASEEEGVLEDDVGYRKHLGIEAGDDEEEAKKEAGLAADDDTTASPDDGSGQQGQQGQQGGAAAGAGGADNMPGGLGGRGTAAAAAGSVDDELSMMEDEELEELDDDDDEFVVGGEDLDLDRLAEERERSIGLGVQQQPAKRRKGSVGPPSHHRDRSPAPSRLATPPLGAAAAAGGGSRATPPIGGGRQQRAGTPPVGAKGAAGGGRQGQAAAAAAGGSRKTPPPAAAAGGGASRRTPPPAAAGGNAAKRKREEAAAAAAAAGAAAGAAGAAAKGYRWRPEQLDVDGVPTAASVAQALAELCPITTGQLSLLQDHLDVGRIGDAGKKLLKTRIMQVAKIEAVGDVKYVVLKKPGGAGAK